MDSEGFCVPIEALSPDESLRYERDVDSAMQLPVHSVAVPSPYFRQRYWRLIFILDCLTLVSPPTPPSLLLLTLTLATLSWTERRRITRGHMLQSWVVIFTERKRLRQDTYQQQGLSNPEVVIFTDEKAPAAR